MTSLSASTRESYFPDTVWASEEKHNLIHHFQTLNRTCDSLTDHALLLTSLWLVGLEWLGWCSFSGTLLPLNMLFCASLQQGGRGTNPTKHAAWKEGHERNIRTADSSQWSSRWWWRRIKLPAWVVQAKGVFSCLLGVIQCAPWPLFVYSSSCKTPNTAYKLYRQKYIFLPLFLNW